jgi:hypothetical protein
LKRKGGDHWKSGHNTQLISQASVVKTNNQWMIEELAANKHLLNSFELIAFERYEADVKQGHTVDAVSILKTMVEHVRMKRGIHQHEAERFI